MKGSLDTIFLNSNEHPPLDLRISRGNFSWNSADNQQSEDIALKDIDLSIARGSLVLILGRVGSKFRLLFFPKHSPLANRWKNHSTEQFSRRAK
jgi:hypothetical protein